MQPTQAQVDQIYRERVLRARRMPPEEKLLAGAKLFEYACWITEQGIRNQFPDATDQRVLEILKQRLALRKRMEQQG